MPNTITESVTEVHHWNDTLFSFKTTRADSFRFENGEFVMLGLEVDGKPLMRAYSIASANYAEHLEFFSIKVPDGPLTSRLAHLTVGDDLVISTKPTGTLTQDRLCAGKHLYLLSSGTGLAPFMSIIQDPRIYDNFDKIILAHCVRYRSELAYRTFIEDTLPNNEFFGNIVKQKLIYYPSVTRESFCTTQRLTTLLDTGQLASDNQLPPISIEHDRFMLCGNPGLLQDLSDILERKGFRETARDDPGHFVIERAFVER